MAIVTPVAYGTTVALGVATIAVLLVAARTHPGGWTAIAARVIGTVLAVDAVSFVVAEILHGTFSAKTDLPLALCDMGVIVAALACWTLLPLLVELTYFWGLAGTLQAIITPDLNVGFPHLVFFQYMAGHIGIVMAALFLVVGMRITPRRHAVPRVLLVTMAYTAFVGLVDGITGANYMFLRSPPSNWTLLSVLGPWPWYVLSATGVALVLLVLLDAPFWRSRAREVREARSGRRPEALSAPGHRNGASGAEEPRGPRAQRPAASPGLR